MTITAENSAIDTVNSTTIVTSPSHIGYLDGWRGLAICSVIVGHFFHIPGISFARFGVELFFVLSGRLMAEILIVRRQPISTFMKRRISRVWPALALFTLAMAIIGRVPLIHGVGIATFTENYVSIFHSHVQEIDHLWSLSIEEWTYVALAFVAMIIEVARFV